MGYCISVAIEKGGVGKTATATNLAWPFSRLLTELAGEHAALTGNRV